MKKGKSEYQIKFRIEVIVGVNVIAEDEVVAMEKAGAVMNKEIFIKELEYIDGREQLIGWDNISLWEIDQ